jgi:chemotaxis protein MotB
MKSSLIVALAAVLLIGAGGCVAQQHADELAAANRALKEQVVELQQRIDELNQRISILQNASGERVEELSRLRGQRDELQRQLNELLAENEQLKVRVRELAARPAQQLPAEVESALRQFARNYPDLAIFDETTNAVKLASDLTFDLGSAELNDQARRAINELAGILTSDAASNYEVRIVGHTDSVPIRKPSTREKHPTNWHLSVHRAIAVRDALSDAGVADLRTSVSGYGPYRPVVQNTASGAAANRRVEIFLLPMTPVDPALIQPAGAGPDGAPQPETDTDNAPAGGPTGSTLK